MRRVEVTSSALAGKQAHKSTTAQNLKQFSDGMESTMRVMQGLPLDARHRLLILRASSGQALTNAKPPAQPSEVRDFSKAGTPISRRRSVSSAIFPGPKIRMMSDAIKNV
jgi:hypothetical protein